MIHAGLTIPNYDNNNPILLEEGAYAIEPFSTTGVGIVQDGKPSGIYRLEERKAIRDSLAREILNHIEKEYKTLPFCSRWIVKKFGTRAIRSLKLMEQSDIIHQYPQLVEKSGKPVAQAEHTIIITDKAEVTTR
jgi:methionyl aminopeptidase